MNLLDVVNINDSKRIFKCIYKGTYYKMENNELLFREEDVKEWKRSTLTIKGLRQYNVEEVEIERKESDGEIYYFINDEGSVLEDEEGFSIVDDKRYEFGNYFKNKEDAEECRELIIKTIRAFKQGIKNKQELEEQTEIEKDCKYLSCHGDCMLHEKA